MKIGIFARTLCVLRDNPKALVGILATVNVLNLADFLFTLVVLDFGGREANPILRPLLALNPLAAGIFKLVVVLAATILLWKSRYYRQALVVGLLMLILFSGLIVYHIVLLVLVG